MIDGAASAAAPHVGLTPQQRLLLALSELEDSRARESSSRARAADGTDDSSAFAAGSRSAAGEGVAAVGTAATASYAFSIVRWPIGSLIVDGGVVWCVLSETRFVRV